DLFEKGAADQAVGNLVEGLARHVDHTRRTTAAGAVRQREPAQEATTEELTHAARRVEEVDGVPARRRVDDDEVVCAAAVQLVQALDRDVVVALHEALREVLVEAVVQD